MKYEIYFPKGIAKNYAFCNRELERNRLKHNIEKGLHTLVMSPRRYGKTSLIKYVINENNFTFGEADLFVAIDAQHVEQRILEGIKQIIKKTSSSLEHSLQLLRDYFQKISAKWVIGTEGINIALTPDRTFDPTTNIMHGLGALEDLLTKKQQKAVLFLDEVQVIGEVAHGSGIEGAIRYVIQQTEFLSLVFSGSNRHLLRSIFYDDKRPLYKLCDRILLDRISKPHYEKHINTIAQKTWGQSLSQQVLEKILAFSELHPFYINSLCLELWELCADKQDYLPKEQDVDKCWYKLIQDERLETVMELSSLSLGQRKVLLAIANGYVSGLTGKDFLKKVNMSSSSINEILRVLVQRDYIEQLEDLSYTIIDPLIKSTLQLYF